MTLGKDKYFEILKRLREERRKKEEAMKHFVEGAPTYNNSEPKFQLSAREIYRIKHERNELNESQLVDYAKGIEYCAILYLAQSCAFRDVIEKQGFEPVLEVPKDADLRIAILTALGTFTVHGKPNPRGRLISMKRIQRIETLNFDHYRGNLENNPEINKRLSVKIYNHPIKAGYTTSNLRAIAINSQGTDEDGLEEQGRLEQRAAETMLRHFELETERSVHKLSRQPLEVR